MKPRHRVLGLLLPQPLPPRGGHPRRRSAGAVDRAFSLLELLVTAFLIALIGSAILRFSAQELERAEVNALAVQLSGWLEAIQRAAMRLPAAGADSNAAGCEVTFNLNGSSLTSITVERGDGLEAGNPEANACSPEPSFRIPTAIAEQSASTPQRLRISLHSSPAGHTNEPLQFTPRGTVVNPASLDVVIRHRGSSEFTRCVRVNGITGLIEIGRGQGGAGGGTCDPDSFTDLI